MKSDWRSGAKWAAWALSAWSGWKMTQRGASCHEYIRVKTSFRFNHEWKPLVFLLVLKLTSFHLPSCIYTEHSMFRFTLCTIRLWGEYLYLSASFRSCVLAFSTSCWLKWWKKASVSHIKSVRWKHKICMYGVKSLSWHTDRKWTRHSSHMRRSAASSVLPVRHMSRTARISRMNRRPHSSTGSPMFSWSSSSSRSFRSVLLKSTDCHWFWFFASGSLPLQIPALATYHLWPVEPSSSERCGQKLSAPNAFRRQWRDWSELCQQWTALHALTSCRLHFRFLGLVSQLDHVIDRPLASFFFVLLGFVYGAVWAWEIAKTPSQAKHHPHKFQVGPEIKLSRNAVDFVEILQFGVYLLQCSHQVRSLGILGAFDAGHDNSRALGGQRANQFDCQVHIADLAAVSAVPADFEPQPVRRVTLQPAQRSFAGCRQRQLWWGRASVQHIATLFDCRAQLFVPANNSRAARHVSTP